MTNTIRLFALLMATTSFAWAGDTSDGANNVARGRAISFDRGKGNCLACHAIAGGELTGNFGPPLLSMALRYPDRVRLRAQIWDATVRVPGTTMPPFGRHRILTEEEIDLVVDFILSL